MRFYEIFNKDNIGKRYNMFNKNGEFQERVFLDYSNFLYLYVSRTNGKHYIEHKYTLDFIVNARFEEMK